MGNNTQLVATLRAFDAFTAITSNRIREFDPRLLSASSGLQRGVSIRRSRRTSLRRSAGRPSESLVFCLPPAFGLGEKKDPSPVGLLEEQNAHGFQRAMIGPGGFQISVREVSNHNEPGFILLCPFGGTPSSKQNMFSFWLPLKSQPKRSALKKQTHLGPFGDVSAILRRLLCHVLPPAQRAATAPGRG